jgi:hypothetical protein
MRFAERFQLAMQLLGDTVGIHGAIPLQSQRFKRLFLLLLLRFSLGYIVGADQE